MYNKKIAPLIPYAIRGAIWCQGTHNADNGKIYAAKMGAMVHGWRKNWGRPATQLGTLASEKLQ